VSLLASFLAWAIAILFVATLVAVFTGYVFGIPKAFVVFLKQPSMFLTPGQESPSSHHVRLAAAVNTVARDVGKVVAIHEIAESPVVVIFEERHDSQRGQIEIALMLNRLYEGEGL